MRRLIPAVLALSLLAGTAPRAGAQAVRSGFLSTPMARGDDNYAPSDYGFDINFYGFTSNAGEVCTNGYVILNFFAPSTVNCGYPGPLAGGDPPSIPNLANLRSFYGSTMAPNFTDFNTAATGSGTIDIGAGLVNGKQSWAATWNGVLGANGATATTPSFFQLVLTSLNSSGDFIMEYNYDFMAAGTEGGIGYTVDTAGIATFAAAGVTEPDDTRISCTFIAGRPTCDTSLVVTPEPASLVLMGTGLLGVLGFGYRRRRSAL